MTKVPYYPLTVAGIVGLVMSSASAELVILSPIAATATSTNGINDLDIGNTIDQSGLQVTFTSGVTKFDPYVASDPLHDSSSARNEWFGGQNFPGGRNDTLVFDLGQSYTVEKIAFWNEEFAGIGSFDLRVSSDDATYTPAGTFSPTNNPGATGSAGIEPQFWYLPDVFTLSPTELRYLELSFRGPAPGSLGYFGSSLGEFAVGVTAIPEPSSAAVWLALASVSLACVRHRKTLVPD